ncbi:MAG TPA: DEAD/DEAH box helicase [Acidimicrobiia bacterium]|nr:DEAD/DEAH box helicase [Acidimicrobiia bacterium]
MVEAALAVDSAIDDRVETVAGALVAAGRFVPGLAVRDDGRARSWWWPLPAASDREAIASLCSDASVEAQRDAAARLAEAVDRRVRAGLVDAGVALLPRRGGRPTAPEAWLRSLTAPDPWLPATLDRDRLRVLEDAVADWVASGSAATGRTRLCLRLREPDGGDGPWVLELLLQDVDEPSLLVPASMLWAGDAPLGPDAVEELLRGLGRLARLAPELASVLDEAAPEAIVLDAAAVLAFVRDRAATLADAGIGVLLPAWWSKRRRLGLRMKASTRRSAPGGAGAGGLGMDAIVSFEWVAALGDRRLTPAELRRLEAAAAAKQELVRVRGEWVELRPHDLDVIRARMGTRDEATVADILTAGLGLEPGDAAGDVEITGVEATGWLARLLDDALHSVVAPIPTPDGFAGTLRPYQERGVGWLVFLGRLGLGACLADDMGLGKTAQLIASVLADPVPGPTLVVCPVSVLGNWERELARFAPGLSVLLHHGPARFTRSRVSFAKRAQRVDVVLTSYSLIARDVDELVAVPWSRVVLDEAQQVKNPATAQARAAARIGAARRVALTGTPVENRLSELWSIMHLLNPGLLGSARSFRERFAVPIERDHDTDATAALRRLTGPFVLRRLKTDKSIIDDLPDKIETTESCPLTREQATLYQAVVDDLIARSEEAEGIQRRGLVLAGLTRLKQVCNHPAHLLRDGSPLPRRSGKLTRTEELLEEIVAEGAKALCFTQFAEWGELLRPYLAARLGVEVGWLHGGVPRRRRDQMVAAFQDPDGPPVLLVSLKAGGTGLNLTAASHVVHLDRWWNPAVEDQATDRAYRIGQTRAVQVHKLVSIGTVEEHIDAMLATKRRLAESVVGSGEEWITELSTDELREVVALRADAVEE